MRVRHERRRHQTPRTRRKGVFFPTTLTFKQNLESTSVPWNPAAAFSTDFHTQQERAHKVKMVPCSKNVPVTLQVHQGLLRVLETSLKQVLETNKLLLSSRAGV